MGGRQVVIDGRPLVGNRTGIGVHVFEIARRLPFDTIIASHKEITDRAEFHRSSFIVHRSSFGVTWQQFHLPKIAGDVLWGPHGTLPLASRIPGVVTLHDFTSITMPGRHRLKTILSFNLFIGASLEKASRVACVSRLIADEAMRGFGVPAWKIELVPNGVDEFFSPAGEEGDYVLYAGTLEPRKGLDDLLAVWKTLPSPRPRLVLCGAEGWGRATGKPGNREAIEVTGYVTRERLRELYRGARAFVYPSHYEGFGIPPLEAMACGAPVIATRTGAIPEYAEGAALLVAPRDRDALRDALARMLRDSALRRELRARGPERAKKFAWDASARTMAELLRDA
ncbi:MAG TPA: glycosyltransferase family 1 protein [Thermoanaerobaculia bacterium]|nr:glycosyltransferase family 1 protein [Thermoanaerobaculia bacterium]